MSRGTCSHGQAPGWVGSQLSLGARWLWECFQKRPNVLKLLSPVCQKRFEPNSSALSAHFRACPHLQWSCAKAAGVAMAFKGSFNAFPGWQRRRLLSSPAWLRGLCCTSSQCSQCHIYQAFIRQMNLVLVIPLASESCW